MLISLSVTPPLAETMAIVGAHAPDSAHGRMDSDTRSSAHCTYSSAVAREAPPNLWTSHASAGAELEGAERNMGSKGLLGGGATMRGLEVVRALFVRARECAREARVSLLTLGGASALSKLEEGERDMESTGLLGDGTAMRKAGRLRAPAATTPTGRWAAHDAEDARREERRKRCIVARHTTTP